jgi:hypothetical protein
VSHSNGPWKIERKGGNRYLRIADQFETAIMCDEQYYPWVPDSDDDWHLIAAAPELLEAAQGALKDLTVRHGDGDSDHFDATPVVKALQAAIAKAKGEGK